MLLRTGVALVLVGLGLSGCASALSPSAFQDGVPELRPDRFFAGPTHSDGVLENRSGEPTNRVHVTGQGVALEDGRFRLDQTVTIDAGEPEHRTWIMTRIDEHHYTASLTDASGPVKAEAYGNLFHVLYPMKSPVGGQFEEWMYLQPDGRTIMNESTIFVFGLVAAHFAEQIVHDGP